MSVLISSFTRSILCLAFSQYIRLSSPSYNPLQAIPSVLLVPFFLLLFPLFGLDRQCRLYRQDEYSYIDTFPPRFPCSVVPAPIPDSPSNTDRHFRCFGQAPPKRIPTSRSRNARLARRQFYNVFIDRKLAHPEPGR